MQHLASSGAIGAVGGAILGDCGYGGCFRCGSGRNRETCLALSEPELSPACNGFRRQLSPRKGYQPVGLV